MRPHPQQTYPLEYDETRAHFHEFLDAIHALDTLIHLDDDSVAIADHRQDRMETEIDTMLAVAEEVYCKMIGRDITIPENYSDVPRVIAAESKETGIPTDRIEEVFREVVDEGGEIEADCAWIKTRKRLERERDRRSFTAGQTTTDDWQVI